jgi:hypothetical protein
MNRASWKACRKDPFKRHLAGCKQRRSVIKQYARAWAAYWEERKRLEKKRVSVVVGRQIRRLDN